MDTVARASQFKPTNYVYKDPGSVVNPTPQVTNQPRTPTLRATLPSTISGTDATRQFYNLGGRFQRINGNR